MNNEVIRDDCLHYMKTIEDNCINLIYLDPPFNSNKVHKLKNKEGYEYSFNDIWNSTEEYNGFMEKRLVECRRILAKDGSILIHCDTSAVHHLRLLADEVFGEQNFRNEIIWSYKKWSNAKKGLIASHQNILVYSKTNQYTFNRLYKEYSTTTNLDQITQERARDAQNKTTYKYNEKNELVYVSEKKGVPLSDVWEIPFLNPKAKERTGYPTQKPLELIERLLKVYSNEGDLILDPFCGSGTTLVAANRLNRAYIGIDESRDAVMLTQKRLEEGIRTASQLLKKGYQSYDSLDENKKRILQSIGANPVYRNQGIDGLINDKTAHRLVAVRIQNDNEPLSEAIEKLKKAKDKRNITLGILFKTHASEELFAADNLYDDIQVIKTYQQQLDELLNYNHC